MRKLLMAPKGVIKKGKNDTAVKDKKETGAKDKKTHVGFADAHNNRYAIKVADVDTHEPKGTYKRGPSFTSWNDAKAWIDGRGEKK